MAYVPPSLRNNNNNNNRNMNYNRYNNNNNNTFRSFNKGKNNRYSNKYEPSNNITDLVKILPNFPFNDINSMKKRFNITISKNNDNQLKLYGFKKDINNFKSYIDEYIYREFKYNDNSFPETMKTNTINTEWGSKTNGKEIGDKLEKQKFLDLAEEKEKERQKILDKANQKNIYKNRDINVLIANLPKLNEEYDRTNEEYYDYYKDPLYTKSFISEQDKLDCELTDEDQYDLMAIKYSEKYSEYWLDDNGEEIFDDEVVTKKEKMELANL